MLQHIHHATKNPIQEWLLAGFVFLVMGTSSCAPSSVESAAPRQGSQAETQLRTTGVNSDAWIVHVGEQSLFTMWISPNIANAPGDALRFITMVGHLPGSSHPFFGQQTQVDVKTNREIKSSDQSGLYSLSVRPNAGLVWGDVKTQEDCQVALNGFY